ncbi:hypothetical protein RRG08_008303 [Elysia crispata]|uniref:Uncharacterized protein n=1 Tax=Elysia crispata TaxID=231223 RepID=A0AAE1DJG5_9GAST|nr:hypothetical protein RRG08_008303 [Elysia crispata]
MNSLFVLDGCRGFVGSNKPPFLLIAFSLSRCRCGVDRKPHSLLGL